MLYEVITSLTVTEKVSTSLPRSGCSGAVNVGAAVLAPLSVADVPPVWTHA